MRPTDDTHWRFRGMYFNRQDPALFVPLRSGMGWTLNFGRPQAIVFLGVFLIRRHLRPHHYLRVLLGE